MRTTHREEKIHTLVKEHGSIYYVHSSPDATSVAFMTCHDPGGRYDNPRLFWNGWLVAQSESLLGHEIKDDLSPSGRHLAVIRQERERGGRYTIDIDGEPTYVTDLDTIHYTGWLDDERFVWEGWNHDEDERIDERGLRFFMNGEEVTGRMQITGICTGAGRSGLYVEEDGYVYTVWEDGERTAPVKIVEGDDRLGYCRTLGYANDAKYDHLRPAIVRNDAGKIQVLHRGIRSPTAFDAIEHEFEVNADGSQIAYVGIRSAKWTDVVGRLGAKLMERADRKRERTGKEPFWAVPFAILFSPYTPFLYPAMEASRRSHPVKARYGTALEERVWKKGYHCALRHLLTPSGELVVTVQDGARQRVVIDEIEGPAFDMIWNTRHVADGDRIAYVAQRGNDLFRVEVRS